MVFRRFAIGAILCMALPCLSSRPLLAQDTQVDRFVFPVAVAGGGASTEIIITALAPEAQNPAGLVFLQQDTTTDQIAVSLTFLYDLNDGNGLQQVTESFTVPTNGTGCAVFDEVNLGSAIIAGSIDVLVQNPTGARIIANSVVSLFGAKLGMGHSRLGTAFAFNSSTTDEARTGYKVFNPNGSQVACAIVDLNNGADPQARTFILPAFGYRQEFTVEAFPQILTKTAIRIECQGQVTLLALGQLTSNGQIFTNASKRLIE